MTSRNTSESLVTSSSVVTEASQAEARPQKRPLWKFVLLGLLAILLGGAFGAWLGYQASLRDRLAAEESQKAVLAATQYQLGLADLQAGRYETARKRFEYVLAIKPDFPGITESLAQAMMALTLQLTPTAVPSPTPEPTKDLRKEDELFAQIQQHLADREWQAAIDTIDTLRKLNLQYRAVDVDGMYYIALRNLGVQNILEQGLLEVGIYNLTLAERFAPLDVDAQNYRIWARQYLSAASFWGVDWARVVNYFAQIYPYLPNLRDGSGMTATERFRIASIKYGDQLAAQGQYCEAQVQYENALAIRPDPMVQPTLTAVSDYCANPPGSEQPIPSETPTPGTPTAEASPTPAAPSDTPTPEATPGS